MIKEGTRVRVSNPEKHNEYVRGETGKVIHYSPESQFGPYDLRLDDGQKVCFFFESELKVL